MNHKIRILLVEDNLDKRSEFRHSIHSHERLELCAKTGKEEEGLNLLKTRTPDVVILDLELEEGNGITFAEKMRAMPISQPFVVVTTNNCSSSISQYLRYDLKIDFIFQKTNASYTANQVLDIIEKIYKYHDTAPSPYEDEKIILRNHIQRELENMGFLSQYSGTDYLIATFMYIADHPDDSLQVSKVIYPMLARQYHSTPSNIERAIRLAIERVWTNTSIVTLSKYYPYEINNKNGRPSNGEFISKMKLKFFGK